MLELIVIGLAITLRDSADSEDVMLGNMLLAGTLATALLNMQVAGMLEEVQNANT
jgi:hypothetical protein